MLDLIWYLIKYSRMDLRLYDAHNHLPDARLAPHREAILAALPGEGVAGMVVNGSGEADWPEVLALTRRFRPEATAAGPACGRLRLIPSFGYIRGM